MRTTIDLDEGLLRVARGLARQRRETLGREAGRSLQSW
jgi:hypothetical protein